MADNVSNGNSERPCFMFQHIWQDDQNWTTKQLAILSLNAWVRASAAAHAILLWTISGAGSFFYSWTGRSNTKSVGHLLFPIKRSIPEKAKNPISKHDWSSACVLCLKHHYVLDHPFLFPSHDASTPARHRGVLGLTVMLIALCAFSSQAARRCSSSWIIYKRRSLSKV